MENRVKLHGCHFIFYLSFLFWVVYCCIHLRFDSVRFGSVEIKFISFVVLYPLRKNSFDASTHLLISLILPRKIDCARKTTKCGVNIRLQSLTSPILSLHFVVFCTQNVFLTAPNLKCDQIKGNREKKLFQMIKIN